MLASESATRLLTKLKVMAQAVDEALIAAEALEGAAPETPDAGRWLPGIKQSLRQIQLECAELQFAAHELHAGLPSTSTLQPRLLD
jgi:type II secretory pathway component PulM